MPTPLDYALEVAPESTYGTAGTPWRGLDMTGESLQAKKETKPSASLRPGRMGARTRSVTWSEGGGSTEHEAVARGMGLLFQALMGSGTSTLVSAGLYQQVFTFASTPPASVTLRKSIPQLNGTTWGQYTFTGAMSTGFELSISSKDILKIKADWLTKFPTSGTTTTLTPTYPDAAPLLTFAGAALSTGTLVAPTTTALASAPTTVCVRDFSVKVDQAYRAREGSCTGGQPGKGGSADLRKVDGSMTIEYDSNKHTDLILSDASISLIATFTSGADAVQVVLPDIKLNGDLPTPTTGDLVSHKVNFEAFHSAAQMMWLVVRTADTAL